MEKRIMTLVLLLGLAVMAGCAKEPAKDDSGDSSAKQYPDLVVSGYSATVPFPASYTTNDGTKVSFTLNIANKGTALASSSEYLMVFLFVTNVNGLNTLSSFRNVDGPICPYYNYLVGGNSGYPKGWTGSGAFTNVDISVKGTVGSNYFYLVAMASTVKGWIDEQNEKDNIYQINTNAIMVE